MTDGPPPLTPAEVKDRMRQVWSSGDFQAITDMVTIHVVPELLRFAGVRRDQRVLDVGTGTGAVALGARRAGAEVAAIDLTPKMIERAVENSRMARVEGIRFEVGDCEALSFPDGSFDLVVSQFAHIFAPRPEVAAREMLRVLRPGGRIAFAAWTREGGHAATAMVAQKYGLVPPGVPDNLDWGEEKVVRERLGPGVRDLRFKHGEFRWRMMSPGHLLEFNLRCTGPCARTLASMEGDGARREAWLKDLEVAYATGADGFGANFPMRYLLARATRAP